MVIITGASQGVGRFLLDRYVSKGELVVGTFNNTRPSTNTDCYHKLDVRDADAVSDFCERIGAGVEEPVMLINCAGVNINDFAHKADPGEWAHVIDTNLLGTFNMMRALLPVMRGRGGGTIINFSSVVALRATPGVSAYAASKAALGGLTKSVMMENAKLGITVNNINLGYSTLGMISQVPEKFMSRLKEQIPCERLCEPEDIFRTVEFIRATKYLNRTSINLTGGLE